MYTKFKSWLIAPIILLVITPIQWVKTLFRIVREHDSQIKQVKDAATNAERIAVRAREVIQERTDLNAEVSFMEHTHSHVIVMGRYKNRDYVEVFSIRPDTLNELVPILIDMQEHAKYRHADGPIGFKAIIDRELDFFNR